MGKIRVERIGRQQLRTGSRPAFPCRIAIVRKKILQPERRLIGVLPIAIAGYNGFFRIGIRFIETFESAYPMLRNIQIVLTRGKEKCSRQVTDLIKYIFAFIFRIELKIKNTTLRPSTTFSCWTDKSPYPNPSHCLYS